MALFLIIITVLVVIAAVLAYINGKRRNELTLIYSNKLIETKPQKGVETLYLGKPISHFVRYEITIFNSGNRDIKPADFLPEPELAFHFNDLQVVSQVAGFSSEGVVPHYQIESPEVVVYFERLKPNEHMSVEVLTGSHSGKLSAPVFDSSLKGGEVKLHHQVFDAADSHARYRQLTQHIAVMMGAFALGFTGLVAGLYSKFKSDVSSVDIMQQVVQFFSVDSVWWIILPLLSLTALLFSFECLKVIAPKFRRYKFEQLVQNKD
ncbi:hypothetical protein EOL70_16410 [Leucothrix sargassi]|nr:hypothetical protein EOL70_16410 [Leucothrix sargassi]